MSVSRAPGAGTAVWEAEGTSSVSLKHVAGDGMAQHVELAFPRDKVCSEPQGDSELGGSLLNK